MVRWLYCVSNFHLSNSSGPFVLPLGMGEVVASSLEPRVLWVKSERPGRHVSRYLSHFVHPSHSGNNIHDVNKFGVSVPTPIANIKRSTFPSQVIKELHSRLSPDPITQCVMSDLQQDCKSC